MAGNRGEHGVFWSSRASGWPRRLLIVAAVALVPAIAGCEAGNDAPTLNWHYPTDGVGTVTHAISIRNVFVLGAPGSAALPAGQSAGLYFALVNDGNDGDRLVSVQAPGSATAVTLPGGSINLPPNRVVLLGGPQPQALLTGLTRPLGGGSVITIVLDFQKAGSVTLRVPIIPNSAAYATFSPAPSPSPTTSTVSPARHKRRHRASSSPSPSAS
ncbi:MAG: copper chaperone PCu(A)C [Streptosporangiaceae bacterium]